MKLKTLKDLKKHIEHRTWTYEDKDIVLFDELKAEAIKWVKMFGNWHKDLSAYGSWIKCPKCNKWFIMLNASFFERGYNLDCPLCKDKIEFNHEMIGPFTNFETKSPEFAIKQFKHFFNITEEDLK